MPQARRSFLSTSPAATEIFAAALARHVKPGSVYALRGGVGAGKTVFARAFARSLGIRRQLHSPTFVLVSQYDIRGRRLKRLYHVDLYRLRRLGLEDRLAIQEVMPDRKGVVLVEWPERVWRWLPSSAVVIDFSVRGLTTRQIVVRRKRR